MTTSFDVTLNGRDHRITVERAESGKDVIRVDGRTAARPLSSDEQERVFAVDGRWYRVRRSGEAFDIAAFDEAVMPNATPWLPSTAAVAPLSENKTAAVSMAKYGWTAAVAVIAILLWVALGPSYPKLAAQRVTVILEDLKGGPDRETTVSRSIWARNARVLDAQELGWADNEFQRWRMAKGFLSGFSSYRIVSSKNVKGTDVPTALVTFVADGREYKVLVPDRRPIKWAD